MVVSQRLTAGDRGDGERDNLGYTELWVCQCEPGRPHVHREARRQIKSRDRSLKGMMWAWEPIQLDRFWGKPWEERTHRWR